MSRDRITDYNSGAGRYDNGYNNQYGAQGGRGYGGNPNNQYNQYGQSNNQYDNQYNRPQQPAAGGYNQYNQPPPPQYNPPQYNSQQYGGYSNHGQVYNNSQQDVEMTTVTKSSNDVTSFFEEISSIQDAIKKMQTNVDQISELHSRSLGTISEDEAIKRQLDAMIADTRTLANQVKDRIKTLEKMNAKLPPNTGDINVRRAQTEALRKKFMEALTNYQQIEANNRQKYRQRLERQYKIVKPGATQDEIDAALDNDEGTQIFAQSLMQSTRYGAAREALKEVQQRHDDIKKIEKTIEELANLFEEMQLMVEVQDTQIDQIEQHANDVEQNLSSGVEHVGKALEHAKSARRKKWCCFLILLIILAIGGLLVYIYVIKPGQGSSNNSSSGSSGNSGNSGNNGNSSNSGQRRLV